MKLVPLRFRDQCHFCGDPVDTRQPGVYSLQIGWMKNRTQGGGNALALRAPAKPLLYACTHCIEARQNGTLGQASLFG